MAARRLAPQQPCSCRHRLFCSTALSVAAYLRPTEMCHGLTRWWRSHARAGGLLVRAGAAYDRSNATRSPCSKPCATRASLSGSDDHRREACSSPRLSHRSARPSSVTAAAASAALRSLVLAARRDALRSAHRSLRRCAGEVLRCSGCCAAQCASSTSTSRLS